MFTYRLIVYDNQLAGKTRNSQFMLKSQVHLHDIKDYTWDFMHSASGQKDTLRHKICDAKFTICLHYFVRPLHLLSISVR